MSCGRTENDDDENPALPRKFNFFYSLFSLLFYIRRKKKSKQKINVFFYNSIHTAAIAAAIKCGRCDKPPVIMVRENGYCQ